MTRSLSVLPVVGMLLLAVACGRAEEPRASPPATATVTVTPSPTASAGPRRSSAQGSAQRPVQKPAPKPTTERSPASTSAPTPPPVDLSGYDLPGFSSPSGNIGCLFDDYEGAKVRCDRLEMDAVPPRRPADCDWGHAVELSVGRPGSLACVSDSVVGIQGETDGSRELPYGDSVRYRGIVCTSSEEGVRCETRGGHGFLISRAAIQVS